MIITDWHDLVDRKRLHDGDVLQVIETPTDPDYTEFMLELPRHKTWWKGLQLCDSTNAEIDFISVQNSRKVAGPIRVLNMDIEVGSKLYLWKAKLFGIYTPMYALADLGTKRGKRITFRWVAD